MYFPANPWWSSRPLSSQFGSCLWSQKVVRDSQSVCVRSYNWSTSPFALRIDSRAFFRGPILWRIFKPQVINTQGPDVIPKCVRAWSSVVWPAIGSSISVLAECMLPAKWVYCRIYFAYLLWVWKCRSMKSCCAQEHKITVRYNLTGSNT